MKTRDRTAALAKLSVPPQVWRAAVGDRVAGVTRPGRLRAGVLSVRTVSNTWAQELTFFSDQILTRLKEAGIEVKTLRFYVAKFETEPLAPPTQARPQAAPAPRVPVELEDRLAKVDDPALRDIIAEAAGRWLDRKITSPKRSAQGQRSAGPESDPPARSWSASDATPRRNPSK